MPKSKRKPSLEKPRPDFPLFPHKGTNRWAKKVRGKLHYFGKVFPDDPRGEKALQLWADQKDDLLAGRVPKAKRDMLTVEELVNRWLDFKKRRIATGELSARCWDEYKALCVLVVETWGRNRAALDLGPSDFAKLREIMAAKWGPVRLGNQVQYVRGIFRWAAKENLLAMPAYGAGFVKPSAKTVRAARNSHGIRMMGPEKIHRLLKAAGTNLKAMVLLAANGGVGPSDIARLPITALDLKAAWVNYPRHKTQVARRFPLWKETVAALQAVLASRPTPRPGCENLVFLTAGGASYIGNLHGERIAAEFRAACKVAKIEGHGMYDLRRGFQTVADGARDPVATSFVMGHAPAAGDMAATYRQTIDDDRLKAVVNVVRTWLFGGADRTGDKAGDEARQATAGAPEMTPVIKAVQRCLAAIAAADGTEKAVLRSVWNESEIALALSGEHSATERFLRQWGDDRPALRVVGA